MTFSADGPTLAAMARVPETVAIDSLRAAVEPLVMPGYRFEFIGSLAKEWEREGMIGPATVVPLASPHGIGGIADAARKVMSLPTTSIDAFASSLILSTTGRAYQGTSQIGYPISGVSLRGGLTSIEVVSVVLRPRRARRPSTTTPTARTSHIPFSRPSSVFLTVAICIASFERSVSIPKMTTLSPPSYDAPWHYGQLVISLGPPG